MYHCTLLWPGGGLVSPQRSNEEKKNPEKPPNSPVVYIAIKGPFLPFLSQASETANPSTQAASSHSVVQHTVTKD